MRLLIAGWFLLTAATASAQPQSYFQVTPDFRRCAAPACGGYWVTALNESLTRCADGRSADRCYVTRLDWSTSDYSVAQGQAVLGDEAAVIVRGKYGPHAHRLGNARFWELDVKRLWTARGSQPATGDYYRVGPTRWHGWNVARPLNSFRRYWFTEVDLTGVNATPVDRRRAEQAHLARELIVSSDSDAVTDFTLVANNFFLPVMPLPVDACLGHEECAEGEYCGDNGVRCVTYPCDVNYNVCKPREDAGGYCADARACQDGLICVDDLCGAPRDECAEDQDCDTGFCGWTSHGERVCKAWSGEGDHCGGFVLRNYIQVCAPHLTCVELTPFIADDGGVCALEALPSELLADPKAYAGRLVGVRGELRAGPAACTRRYCRPEVQCCNACWASELLFDEDSEAGGVRVKEGDEFYACRGQDCDYRDHCSQPEGGYTVLGTFHAAIEGEYIDAERVESSRGPWEI